MEYLFVYGSLMNDIDSKIARFLKANSSFLGEATMPGHLYDLGRYPGAVFDAQADSSVVGHVFQLADAEAVLPVLDRYEGVHPHQPELGEYRRAQVPVQMGETQLDCWTYLYNFTTEKLSPIPGGNYLEYLRGNDDHQNFIRSV